MRPVLIALALAVLTGCKKKTDEDAGAGGGGDTTEYTIKLPDVRTAGAKWDINRVKNTTVTVTTKAEKAVEEVEQEDRYVQTIITPKVKQTRAYQVAKQKRKGTTKAWPYAGQVVTIEKKDDLYTFTMNGRGLTESEAPELFKEFAGRSEGGSLEDLLPKGAVKVGQSWDIDRDVLRKEARRSTNGIDPDKSKMSGRLTKVYTSGGQQWGVIEWRRELVFSEPRQPQMPERALAVITYEGPIDGSLGDVKVVLRGSAEWDEGDPKEGRIGMKFETTETETRIPKR